MSNAILTVTEVSMVAASAADRTTGLKGYITITVNGRLRIEGLTLRRTLAGRLSVSFPEKHHPQARAIVMYP